MSEEELQKYAVMLQQQQQQAEYLQQNITQIQLTIQELDDAIMTLETLDGNGKGQEVLVPIGVGTFLFSEVKDTNRIMVGLGSGVSVERDRETSIKTLSTRKEELDGVLKKAMETYNNIIGQMEQLQAKVQSMMPQQV
jgi:prefoldin alpha subunit